jgi:hypothetical protein
MVFARKTRKIGFAPLYTFSQKQDRIAAWEK